MPTTEHTINDSLAAVLRITRRLWQAHSVVRSENTGTLKANNQRPDILITEANVSPVVIETEVLPASTVEAEALARLGQQLRSNGRTILSSIAVRLPTIFRSVPIADLQETIATALDIEMVLYTGSAPNRATRWPRSGWIRGSVADLSLLAQSAAVPPDVIEEAANHLIEGVIESASLLAEAGTTHPGAIVQISNELRQHPGEQTLRMAMTILANAFVFHETLTGGPGSLSAVRSLEQIRGSGGLDKAAVLAEWRRILAVNYWPIFDIARRILEILPTDYGLPILDSYFAHARRVRFWEG